MFRRQRRGVPMRRGGGGRGFGLFLLMAQIMQIGFNNIPPTTLATIVLNVAIYLKVLNHFIKQFLRPATISQICVSSYHVWYKGDWVRLFLAGWFHLDEWHLYYNMVSFMWKGRGLEATFGTLYFAYLILIFSVMTNVVMVGINIAVAELLSDGSYVSVCAAGFSGVIFALKVLTSHYRPTEMQVIFGFPVPSAWACWIELVVIQLLVPNASFTGHLAGILVGLAYVKGPLKTFMDILFSIDLYGHSAPSYTYTAGTAHGRSTNRQREHMSTRANSERSSGQPSYTYKAGTAHGRSTNRQRGHVSTRANSERSSGQPSYTYTADRSDTLLRNRNDGIEDDVNVASGYQANDFTGGMTEEEQLEAAIRESVRSGGPSATRPSAPLLYPNSSSVHSVSSPSLPSYPDSNQTFTSTSRTFEQPRSYPDPVHNTMPVPMAYNGIDQDELRRRRLARFDR